MLEKMKQLLERIKFKELNGASTRKEALDLLKCIDESIGDNENYVTEIPNALKSITLSDIPLVACKQCIEPLNAVLDVFKKNYEVYLKSNSKEDFDAFYSSYDDLQKMLHFFSDKLMEYGDWVDSYVIPEFADLTKLSNTYDTDTGLRMNFEKAECAIQLSVQALNECDKSTCMALFAVFSMLSVNFTRFITTKKRAM